MSGSLRRTLLLAAVLLPVLSGCAIADWLDDKEKPPLPGERVSVLSLESQLEPDPRIADLRVRLPKPWLNPEWPQSGGYPSHAMYHLDLAPNLTEVWKVSIGASTDSDQVIVAQPVVADGRLYAMDARTRVSAFDAQTGASIWQTSLYPKGEDKGIIGGGVAYDRGTLFVTTGYGEIIALEAQSAKELWRSKIDLPFRSAPTVDGSRVFATTTENQSYAFDRDTGRQVWSHAGIAEQAEFVGGANPAAEAGTVVVPYSSGELYALRGDTGAVAWTDTLTRASRFSPIGTIADIRGRPVIDRGTVMAISHAGRMVAIDQRTGERLWEQDIAGIQQPWPAGDFVYVVTTDAEVVCLWRRDGRIRWVSQLDRWKNPESKRDKGLIVWQGPVLAGDRLIMVSSERKAVTLSPYTGELLGEIKLSGAAATSPVVANGMLYILTDDAYILALR